MPTGVAVPAAPSGFRFSLPYLRVMSATVVSCGTIVALDCITWFQTQLILTSCQIRYHSHCGMFVALDSAEP